MVHSFFRWYVNAPLVFLIAGGLVVGILLAVFVPASIPVVGLLGQLFVGALKAIAPILVSVLVRDALAKKREASDSSIRPVLALYIIGTFCAALAAVAVSFLFPTELKLSVADANLAPPGGIGDVLKNLLLSVVDNPVNALIHANYISILAWSVLFGIAFRNASEATKSFISDMAEAVTKMVQWIIRLAPFGIMGLVAGTIGESGLGTLLGYGKLLAVLLGAFALVALVLNPLVVFLMTRKNPYPLVFATLRESGFYAFFTRSSAANIPVNMRLCERLGLNPDLYAISIPLGSTINMAGAAITITVLSLSAAHTLGIAVDLPTALLLSMISTVGACGASGVAGGSLLLIPVACASFGISNDIAMQVVGVGFIIGVLQDSCETALNSSSDVLFTATAEFAKRAEAGTLSAEDMIPRDRV